MDVMKEMYGKDKSISTRQPGLLIGAWEMLHLNTFDDDDDGHAVRICSCKTEVTAYMLCHAGANIIRGVAGAGVLAGFDKFKQLYVYLRFRNQS